MKETRIKKIEKAVLADLPGRERAKMGLEALADGDREAVRRLIGTCPQKTYRMKEAEFIEPLDGARRVANAGVMIYDRARYALKVLEHCRPEKGKAGAALLEKQRRTILEDFRAAWGGYDNFCREACGVDGLKLLAGLPLAGDWWLPDEYLAEMEEMIGEEIPGADRKRLAKLTKDWTRTLREAFTGPEAEE